MADFDTYTVGQLQIARQIASRWLRDDVSLESGIAALDAELATRHADLQPATIPIRMLCPDCGKPLRVGGAIESDFAEDADLKRVGCKCGYSRVVED